MLIPQFSIRWLLALTTVCAVIFSVFGLAYRGNSWAQGVSVAIVSMVIVFAFHAFTFTVIWGLSTVFGRGGQQRGSSPFAGQPITPPPQESYITYGQETADSPIILD